MHGVEITDGEASLGISRSGEIEVVVMTTGMTIIIGDAPDKEKVFAELYYEGKLWAIVSQEAGPLVLEIASNINGAPSKFSLEDVVSVLIEARRKLLGEPFVET